MKQFFSRLKHPSDLPFDTEGSPQLVPWIIALMIYLATLALVGSALLSKGVDEWGVKIRLPGLGYG